MRCVGWDVGELWPRNACVFVGVEESAVFEVSIDDVRIIDESYGAQFAATLVHERVDLIDFAEHAHQVLREIDAGSASWSGSLLACVADSFPSVTH